MTEPTVGISAVREHTVTDDDTAVALGSGDVPVLATPRVVAWLEGATVACLDDVLDDASTSVGTRVEIDHLAASPVGAHITAAASVVEVDGRSVVFEVAAEHRVGDGAPVLVAAGRVVRAVVDRERFLARLPR
jgi:fluoroacetyl-CoA thioesterase